MTDTKRKILNDFLAENPILAQSKAKISINAILKSSEYGLTKIYDPPKIFITVTHPFIFDRRLIPKEFHGYKVEDVMVGSYPKQFPSEDSELSLDIWFAPVRYINFVDLNLELIRQGLNNPSLTKEEALDALTGGFSKHIGWCKSIRNERERINKS